MSFSCDTFVCMKDETQGGYTALCKNSDRHPNETHEVVIVPEIKIDDSTIIECTYTKVSPPKAYSHRCLLCKPVWMWGAEMGSNEAGVCIGNEAAFSNSKPKPTHMYNNNYPGDTSNEYLTGMDLLRLALMFGDSALDAVKIIDHYLQEYQQNGNMAWMADLRYYSTYLVADYNEIWIVETINQYLVAKKYIHGIHAISNRYTLSAPFDMISTALRDYCDENNIDWKDHLNIYTQFGDWKRSYFSDSYNRQSYVQTTLQQIAYDRKLNINDFTQILRSHQVRNNANVNTGLSGMDICAHASYGPVRCSNTTGSLICIMRRDGTVTNFVTGTSSPCISTFKPIYVQCSVPRDLGVEFRKFCNGNFMHNKQTFDGLLKKKNDIISTSNMLVYNQNAIEKQLWWKHEVFHRLYLKYFVDNQAFNEAIKNRISEFEKNMFEELVEEYHEYNSVHCSDQQIVCVQQNISDKYWKESYKILDEMLKQTQNEILSGNTKNDEKKMNLLFSMICKVFNGYSLLTKYLHQTQWSYWNKLAGIYVSKKGMVSHTPSTSSLSAKTNNTGSGLMSMFLSLFGGNGVFRWIKVVLASVWSILLLAIGWKLLN